MGINPDEAVAYGAAVQGGIKKITITAEKGRLSEEGHSWSLTAGSCHFQC